MFKAFRSGLLFFSLIFFANSSDGQNNIGTQRFEIRTETKSFEKFRFKKLSDVKAAVAKYRASFNSRSNDLDRRCSNHFGPGYRFNGLNIKERAIGYMNEELPIEKFQWKRLVAEVFIYCVKTQ